MNEEKESLKDSIKGKLKGNDPLADVPIVPKVESQVGKVVEEEKEEAVEDAPKVPTPEALAEAEAKKQLEIDTEAHNLNNDGYFRLKMLSYLAIMTNEIQELNSNITLLLEPKKKE